MMLQIILVASPQNIKQRALQPLTLHPEASHCKYKVTHHQPSAKESASQHDASLHTRVAAKPSGATFGTL
jgi:hypothetical protein